ncbi:MAG: hypothetical protein ACFE0O_03055 [Opitutales bacterium]
MTATTQDNPNARSEPWQARAKTAFLRLSRREKGLLILFLAVMVLIWAGSSLNRLSERRLDLRESGLALENQATWLGKQADIQARLEAALANLDPDSTYTGAELVATADEMARATLGAGNYEIRRPVTRSEDIFNTHTIQVRARRIDLGALMAFEAAIRARGPYIGLDRLRLSANPANPSQLDAQATLTSFELKTADL